MASISSLFVSPINATSPIYMPPVTQEYEINCRVSVDTSREESFANDEELQSETLYAFTSYTQKKLSPEKEKNFKVEWRTVKDSFSWIGSGPSLEDTNPAKPENFIGKAEITHSYYNVVGDHRSGELVEYTAHMIVEVDGLNTGEKLVLTAKSKTSKKLIAYSNLSKAVIKDASGKKVHLNVTVECDAH